MLSVLKPKKSQGYFETEKCSRAKWDIGRQLRAFVHLIPYFSTSVRFSSLIVTLFKRVDMGELQRKC